MSSERAKHLADALHSSDGDRIVKALEEMTAEVHALWQTMEELRTDLIHVLRNPPQEWEHAMDERVIECITCDNCDATCDSLAEAVQEGWTDLCRDDGPSWNYLGKCVDCQKAEAEEDRRAQERLAAARAMPEQSGSTDSGRLLF